MAYTQFICFGLAPFSTVELSLKTVYDLKPAFQNLLRPVTQWLFVLGITANHVTVMAMLLSLLTGSAMYFRANNPKILLLLPPVLLLRMALNAIDGMLAREHAQASSLGAVLNELGDVVSDAGLYLPLSRTPFFNSQLIVSVVLLAALAEMTGVVAQTIGATRRYDGPMGKSDRALVFGIMALLIGAGFSGNNWPNYVLMVMIGLLAWTIWNRARRALQQVQSR